MVLPIIFLLSLQQPREIVVDLSSYTWIALDSEGKVVKSGVASGGRRWCPDIERRCKTPVGTFKVVSKKGRFYRSPLYPVGCDNSSVDNKCAPMPWAIKFKHSGEAIHGHRGEMKRHTSHGCVHVSYEDAKWLNEFVATGDTVKIREY